MVYNLYLSRNPSPAAPFITVGDSTIDSTSSVLLIGRRKTDYGQSQDQSFLWMLEHFANSSAPSNPIVGQLWYDTAQSELKVYQLNNTWKKISAPQASATAPVSPDIGQLWFDTVNQVLKAWNGSFWLIIGPLSILPSTSYQQFLLTGSTSNNTTTELFINGITNSRMTIPAGSVWRFDLEFLGKRTDAGTEAGGWSVSGVVYNNSGSSSFVGNVNTQSFGYTSSWSVGATVDDATDTLRVNVTGETGKVIAWDCIVTLYKKA